MTKEEIKTLIEYLLYVQWSRPNLNPSYALIRLSLIETCERKRAMIP